MEKVIKVAVVGNPNVGKSALINAIAGTNIKVGNWTGVTVEKIEAQIEYKGFKIHFIDLPGIYSIANKTAEEKITIDFLINQKPDIILNVIDSTNLKRNLYLTIQLLELEIPMVIALNMWDELGKRGIKIDSEKFSKLLCAPAIPTSALRNLGINSILDNIIKTYENKDGFNFSKCEQFETQIEDYLKRLKNFIEQTHPGILELYPQRYLLTSILEGSFDGYLPSEIKEYADRLKEEIEKVYHKDIRALMIEERYGLVLNILKQTVKEKPLEEESLNFSLALDRIFLHRYLGLPIFFILVWLTFEMTFTFSTPFVDWLDNTLSNLSLVVNNYLKNSPDWLRSFITEGVLGGVGFVLVFTPVLFTLYIILSFLEGSGYIARAAFLMDRFMSIFGLSGKSFIPLLLGFGCNVPAVYATRTIDSPKEKILTALMIPFMSCGARLTVFAFFVSIFFTNHRGLVIFSLYIMGIFSAIVIAILLNKFYFKLEHSYFILELPPYRMPTLRYMLLNSWIRVKSFIIEAGSFIFATSVVIWFLTNIPFGVKKEDSILGKVAKEISVIFEPLGFGTWQATTSLFAGFVAKEVVLSTMGNVYMQEVPQTQEDQITVSQFAKDTVVGFFNAFIGLSEEVGQKFGLIEKEREEVDTGLMEVIRDEFTPASAYSFLVFLLLYTPCLATVFAIRQELGSNRWMIISVLINFTTAYIMSFIVYNFLKIYF
ncbi:MAG: ferrous iron transport protein B [Hydrogenothermaceae bacterium]|nr:ferrous iron transport protein B [Hydrogenothermaceae bacterium]